MEYRLGRIEDIDKILKIISQAIKVMNSKGIYQWDEIYPTSDDFMDDISKENLYVALADRKIIAVYVINNLSDPEYKKVVWRYPDETSCVLHRFCVSPKFQNKGYGKQILNHIEEHIKDMGYQSIRLDVFTENPFAQRLYRKNGYEVKGYADWRKGRFDLMEKGL